MIYTIEMAERPHIGALRENSQIQDPLKTADVQSLVFEGESTGKILAIGPLPPNGSWI
jgi:hypothetical protein